MAIPSRQEPLTRNLPASHATNSPSADCVDVADRAAAFVFNKPHGLTPGRLCFCGAMVRRWLEGSV